ncbi:MAG: hypothetical protein J6M57_04515 [Acidaminococcaceae bacterium]|nr:hypothetical protein [Acidaminococcaceae bacterium]
MMRKQSLCSRIRNARASLDNAERSFRSNQDVRGELDLMLAEAELENLRQKRSGWISWTRHTLALFLAVLILAAGGLGWWWASSYGGNTTNAAGLQAPVTETERNSTVSENAENRLESVQERKTPSVVRVVRTEGREKSSEAESMPSKIQGTKTGGGSLQLSSSQMRQLIRSGKQELGNIR